MMAETDDLRTLEGRIIGFHAPTSRGNGRGKHLAFPQAHKKPPSFLCYLSTGCILCFFKKQFLYVCPGLAEKWAAL